MLLNVLLGAAILVDDIAAHDVVPSADRLAKWNTIRKAELQAEAAEEAERLAADHAVAATAARAKARNGPEVVSAKQAEREAKRTARAAAALSNNLGLFAPNDPPPYNSLYPSQTPPVEPPSGAKSAPPLTLPISVTIPAISSTLPWYPSSASDSAFASASPITARLLDHAHEHTTIASARAAGLWSFPATEEDRARCAVFRDLHEKGHWMGGGIKFGGDWLVYPGMFYLSMGE